MTAVLLMAVAAIGQSPAPGLFNYQGVARNSVGNVLINKTISLRLTIHDGTPGGPSVYQETRTVTTNPFGLFNVQVGGPGASSSSGTIPGVNWGVNAKYIQVEIDPNGGSTFINIGTAQIASVPYALYSSLSNDLVLPFNKTQSDAGTLFKVTNSGTGAGSTALEGLTNSTAGNAYAVIGTVTSSSPGGFSTGVRGINNGTGGLGIGVWGSQNGSGWGVYGTAPSGVGGNFATTSGIAVNATATTGDGLRSTTNGAFGKFGVFGIATADATGVAGNSGSGIAVLGVSGTGPSGVFQNFTAASTATTLTAFNQGGSGDAFSSVTTGTGKAGLFQVNNAASSANALQVITNTTSAPALAVKGPGIWGSAIGIENTASGMEWRMATHGTSFIITKVPGSTFTPFQLFSDGQVEFASTAGATRLRILDNGNVGVGTATPTTRFHVAGQVRIVDGTEGLNKVLASDANGNASWQTLGGGVGIGGSGTLNFVPKWTPNGTNLGNSLLFDNGTRMGVGTTTPSHRFTVSHGGGTGLGVNSTAGFSVVDINAFNGDGALRFLNNGVSDWHIGNGSLGSPGGLDFWDLKAGVNRMMIQNGTGNVGISTNNPGARFHVENTDAAIPTSFINKTNAANTSNALNVLDANTTTNGWGNAAIQGRRGTGSGATTYLYLGTTAIAGIATTGGAALGVQGTSDAGISVAGLSTNGIGVAGLNMNSGSAGVFQNQLNATNAAPVVDVNNISTVANAYGVRSTIANTAPGGFSAALRGINNGTGGLGIGVWGSQNGSGWGVYGTAPSGIGVLGSSTSGVGGRFTTTSGQALYSTGAVRLEGINEAANRILATVPGDGTATWQDPAAVGIVSGSGTLNYVPKWTPNGTTLGNSLIFDDGQRAQVGDNVIAGSSFGLNPTPGSALPSITWYKNATGQAFNINETDDGNLHVEANSTSAGIGTKIMTFDDGSFGVGIGTTTPVAKMELRNYNSTLNNFTTPSGFTGATGIGVVDATVESSFKSSIYAFADGATGSNISVWGDAGTTSNVANNGLFGRVSLAPTGTGFSAGLVALDAVNGPNTWAAIIRGRLQYQDGTQGAGKVLTSDANGNASWVGRVAFRAIGYSGGAITSNTDLIVDNVVYDDASGYNATTGQFTAPVAGLYHFDAGMRGSNANIGRTNFCFISNLQGFFSCSSVDVTASNQTYSAININGDILLAAGEIVTVRVEPISGSYTPLNNPNYIYFNGHRVH